tara:strand:+ start:182 stop:475 length:294 start_codon:yes stop_codon:yes gene_type:complete
MKMLVVIPGWSAAFKDDKGEWHLTNIRDTDFGKKSRLADMFQTKDYPISLVTKWGFYYLRPPKEFKTKAEFKALLEEIELIPDPDEKGVLIAVRRKS